ncbi:hypothetical protein EPUS_02706 [Endocarpon pusillum Z07020]|uniref:Peptidase S1 domain-containing protein n=1 Tax=Endocarpon pusillum (strain Z07020 / HMAS-L-300199) TaxID=1263415 RepID=U1HDZ2_ENDPU|nr:uncharacterized protein EPUS_02706 [Endocarpon pusillum Z07020]ERF68250.1 hypothetical protein EPUS_02706 [Endocarpon pusillum Z07020]
MGIINGQTTGGVFAVDLSHDVRDAALNLNLKAYEFRRTLAAVWNVKPTRAEPPPAEAAISLDMKNESIESVVGGGDERLKVDNIHFAPGGKYRSIVKLFIRYEFQPPGSWAMGTGWLISPDIFVTAGHCSYDWGHKWGRAEEVKAYIGYSGRDSEKSRNVQFRQVKRIVTTEGWVKTKGSKAFDVSFMQVDTPFTGIRPIRYEETPARGNFELGVVGYPGDLSDKYTGEKGAHMYEMFLRTEFDLAGSPDTMLEYNIDTFGGNSGSPVLRQSDLVSLGVHVYGGAMNSASVIGKFGNPYKDYLAAFDLHLPSDALHLMPVTESGKSSATGPSGDYQKPLGSNPVSGSKSRVNGNDQGVRPQVSSQHQRRPSAMAKLIQSGVTSRSQAMNTKSESLQAEEFAFMDILKVVGGALPIIGGPIGALAGFALNAASSVAAESTGAESVQDGTPLHEGSMERAILAEATLSALQAASLPDELEESIFSDMKDAVMRALPIVRKAAPHVMSAMMEPALKIALDSLHKHNQSGAESFEAAYDEPFQPTTLYSSAIDQEADADTENFLGVLQSVLQRNLQESAVDGDAEEGFLDIIKAGARLASKGVVQAAKFGLPILVDAVKNIANAESLDDQTASAAGTQGLTADQLAKRALVADAALEAVMKLPAQHLEEFGFIDFIGDAVKKIAGPAMKVLPQVAKAINPVVGNVISNLLGQDSPTARGNKPAGAARRALPASDRLAPKRSLASLRQNSGKGTVGGAGRHY